MENSLIDRIEFGTLVGVRPRLAGNNSRIPVHGLEVELPLIRLTTADGASGFGAGRTDVETAQALLGRRFSDLLSPEGRVREDSGAFEFPLWDLLGVLQGVPVYELVARDEMRVGERLRVQGRAMTPRCSSTICIWTRMKRERRLSPKKRVMATKTTTATSKSRSGAAPVGCPWKKARSAISP